MATTAAAHSSPPSSSKSGLFRSLTSKLVRKDEEAGTSLKPHRAGTLRNKAREQMRTGRAAVDHDVRPPSLTIGDDGWGSDGKLYVRNLDNEHPPSSFNSSSNAPPQGEDPNHEHHHHHHHHTTSSSSSQPQPTSSSIRPVQRDLSAPSPYSLPLASNSLQPNPSSSPSRPSRQQPPSDAFRSPSRTQQPSSSNIDQQHQSQHSSNSSSSQPNHAHAHFDAPPSQGRARSHSHSQSSPHHVYSHSSSEAPPPLPTNGYSLTESYAPPTSSAMPRSKSGPDQRAGRLAVETDSGGYQPRPRNLVDEPGSASTPASSAGPRTPASAHAEGAGKEGWAKVKRGMTLVRKSGREARAQEQAAAHLDPNRPPSPLRKAAAPKMYSPAELAMEIEKAEKAAAEQAAAAYRASSMVPRKTKQEAAEESRLTESAFY